MIRFPDHVHENLLRSTAIVFPKGATKQGSREFVFTTTATVSNAFRKCDLPIRLGLDAELRTITGLTVCTGTSFYTVPAMLMGGVLTLGRERVNLEQPESVALLLRAILKAIAEIDQATAKIKRQQQDRPTIKLW